MCRGKRQTRRVRDAAAYNAERRTGHPDSDKKSGIPLYFQNEGADPAALQDYVDHYSAVSPRVAAGKWLAAGAVSCDYDFLTETEMDRDEFYVDFMQPQGYRYFVSANLINDAKTFGVFSVQRRIEQGHVSDGELALMRRLAPHLSQAVKIRMRLAAAESRGRAESFLFEKSATGVVFLGCDGAVQSLNPAAEELLRALFGLTPAESRLARALLGGQTLGDYAEQAKIGIRTARTHLSNVLGKTGARNQIALVRLLGGLSYDI